jgi:predicted P-loop ATPase/GTPase
MRTRKSTYTTAQGFIDTVNNEAREIELLESLLSEKRRKVDKTLAKLRAYKRRGIVKQINKYKYELTKTDI